MVVVVVSRILSAPLVSAKEHPSSASSPSLPSRRCGPLQTLAGAGVLFDLYDAGGAVQGIATIPEFIWELSLGIYPWSGIHGVMEITIASSDERQRVRLEFDVPEPRSTDEIRASVRSNEKGHPRERTNP
jgi:hypothetical protein